MKDSKIRLGVSIGDLNGIGMEIIMRTFADNRMLRFCTPIVYGNTKTASYFRKMLNLQDFSFNFIKNADEANPQRANLVNCWDEEVVLNVGQSTPEGGKYALISLQSAVADLKAGKIDVLVTAPINKHNIQADEFAFPGHTEYLQKEFGAEEHLMFLVSDQLKVGIVTGHIPISEVAQVLSIDRIMKKLTLMNTSLMKDFDIRKPKIAVLGLNPHAGEEGLIGTEDQAVILPAINMAKEKGVLAFGPYPADGFFGTNSFLKFDAVLAMYHDQGLIPFKTIAFEDGVNFTAGLSIIRTSPDHGTGYDIAGKKEANIGSFRSAVYAAIEIFNNRKNQQELEANAMVVKGSREKE